MARRATVVVLIALGMILAGAPPASAASDFDADDVEGPLDLRWIGAWFTQDGDFRLTISFYEGFRVSALPKVGDGFVRGRGLARVELTEFISGVFIRRQGRIVFVYGDFASGCGANFPQWCGRAPATRSSDNVLKVRFPTLCDGADLSYEVLARTELKRDERTLRDWTGTLDLGVPSDC